MSKDYLGGIFEDNVGLVEIYGKVPEMITGLC